TTWPTISSAKALWDKRHPIVSRSDQIRTLPPNRNAQITTAASMVPTIPSHSLYGAVSGILLPKRSRMTSLLVCAALLSPCPVVRENLGGNYEQSAERFEKRRSVAFRSQKSRRANICHAN